jgi:stage V sporulation protein G
VEITEVRIAFDDHGPPRLLAYAQFVLAGCFVVRGAKVIAGDGGVFVAMPSRRATSRCGECGRNNILSAAYCNGCGVRLLEGRAEGATLFADVAHPIDHATRAAVTAAVLGAYRDAVAERLAGARAVA